MSHDDLTDEETNELIRRWREHGDRDALQKIVKGHTKLLHAVIRKVGGMSRYDDAYQEASIGLLRAIEKYDPKQGRFWHYAFTWARSFASRYVNNDHLVRVGGIGAQDRGHIHINKATRALLHEGIQPTEWALSERTGMSVEEVFHIRGNITGGLYVDLYRGLEEMDPGRQLLLIERLHNEHEVPLEEAVRSLSSFDERIENFMKLLDGRDLYIFDKRIWTQPPEMTLLEIGTEFGVSREWIRQIEERLIRQLAGYFRDDLIHMGIPGAKDIAPWPKRKAKHG